MAHTFRKLRLLVWKNFILQIRRPIGTCVEILLPVVFLALLILARVNVKDENKCMSNYEDKIYLGAPNVRLLKFKKGTANQFLAYYPFDERVANLLEPVVKNLNISLTNKRPDKVNFTSKEDMINHVKESDDYYLGAITFEGVEESKPLPKMIKYNIRLHHSTTKLLDDAQRDTWYTNIVYPLFQNPGPNTGDIYSKLFLPIQMAIDKSILKTQTSSPTIPSIRVRQMPYPNYRRDWFVIIIQSTMPLIFNLAFIYTAVMIVKELVAEKQYRLKESMKMMGLGNWMHWTAWFIKVMVFFLIIIILQTILLKAGKIFEYTDGGVVFVFLLLYTLSSTFTLFFLSTIFSHAIRGMLFTAVLWFASLAPYLSFSSEEAYENLSNGAKTGSCLLPNSCLGIAIQIISRKESAQLGIQWSNINKAPSVDDTFSLGNCFGILIFDCVLYGFLTWYIENVFPGEFGIPKPPWFFFLPSYWCGTKPARASSVADMNGEKQSSQFFEDEPEGTIGISIQDLRKVYKGARGKKVAVNSLSLNIYKGQITALLGHNGAGKTTTMSILTGLFPPTAGNAYINGNSILTNMDNIRESLGLCPQHNVLFDRLTVKEHLEFFSALKGISKQKAIPEINQMIQDIQLSDKANSQSRTLSGGMKRKLNCAIALIGGSETVFLDEPTSGMDPYARRATWDLLQKYRTNKTIILTTHFMDEADYLGDRIAIMADGELRCCGSSLFLKKRYGVGYHMTIVKGPDFDERQTVSLVNKSIPTSKMVGNLGAEMSYVLEESSTPYFKDLFVQLEDNKKSFGITSFGVSVTTLEEVFLKVCEGESLSGVKDTENVSDMQPLRAQQSDVKIDREALLSGISLFWSQFVAMFVKRLLNSKRQKVAIVTQIILPCFLVLCGLLLMSSTNTQADDPARKLTLSMMKEKESMLHAFFSDFRTTSDRMLKKHASAYFASVDTLIEDIKDGALAIKANNSDTDITLQFTESPLSLKTTDLKNCCKYKYYVLNQNCKNAFTDASDLIRICGSKPEGFGYSSCMDCAFKCPKSKGPDELFVRSIPNTNLTDMTTFFEEYILEDAGKDDESYFNKKVAGFSMHDDGARIWFTPQSWHGLPSGFSAGTNILLKYLTNDSAYGIETTNLPLPRNANEKTSTVANRNILTLVNFCTMAASFIAASFITFLVNEKTSKAKHIQFVSGVSSLCYWSATLFWDLINFLVPALIILILFAAFNLEEFDGELGYVFLVLILFACSMLPFIYLISFIFSSAMIAYSIVALILMVLSLAMVITVFILDATEEEEIADMLNNFFLLIPSYAFPQALRDISTNRVRKTSCETNAQTIAKCAKTNVKYFDNTLEFAEPGIGKHCLYMFIECLVYFTLTILIEENFFIGRFFGNKSTTYSINAREDSDVQEERKKVHSMSNDDVKKSAVVVKNLTKVYRSTGMMAVDHLSYEVSKKQCFGLLGVNGAGKTTTFGMLTGELGITNGTAFLDGYNIQTHLKQVQQRIGYCPQFDALIEKMTGREMLRMFARLRGIPNQKLESVVDQAIAQLNLAKWADKMCGDYSGGNKRKLSTAIALVGDPAIVFLDEPTSGMDPASRRFLWDTLSEVLNSGRSIVLTSHSMEECEALCTKLVIMVNGQLKCIGSIQHLKSRYGRGYTLIMKIGSSNTNDGNQQQQQVTNGNTVANGNEMPETIYDSKTSNGTTNPAYDGENKNAQQLSVPNTGMHRASSAQCLYNNTMQVKNFIQEQFEGAFLVEERQGFLQYQINNLELRWSQIFGALEEHAKDLGVVDYSVSQTSLEQVFINFAKEQHSEERNFRSTCCSCSCF